MVDAKFQYIEILSSGSNEIDVIATFKDASPKIVIKLDNLDYIPYDAFAFMVEVKSALDNEKLERALGKFEPISRLNLSPDRFD